MDVQFKLGINLLSTFCFIKDYARYVLVVQVAVVGYITSCPLMRVYFYQSYSVLSL